LFFSSSAFCLLLFFFSAFWLMFFSSYSLCSWCRFLVISFVRMSLFGNQKKKLITLDNLIWLLMIGLIHIGLTHIYSFRHLIISSSYINKEDRKIEQRDIWVFFASLICWIYDTTSKYKRKPIVECLVWNKKRWHFFVATW
jgi:hypothetical protein